MNSGTGRQIVAASLLVALIVGAHACSRGDAKLGSEEARELYELSHISLRFGVVREFLNAQIALHRATWTPEQFEVATRVLDERLSEEALARAIVDRLAKQPEPRFKEAVLAWLGTSEARQVHAAPAITTDAETAAELKGFMAGEYQLQPSETRLALIERYDRAAHCSSDSSSLLRLSVYGAGVMSDALMPGDARAGDAFLKKFAEEKSELLEPIFEELSVIMLQFAFRGLSDAEVAAFVERSESEPMQWYYRTLSNVFLDTIGEITSDLGTSFSTALESKPSA